MLIFSYVLFYINDTMSKYMKFVILALFISYPFIITPIERLFYQMYKLIKAFITVNPYANNY